MIVAALSFSGATNAADLLIFDSPNMIMLKDRGEVIGYYGSVEGDKNCEFFFYRAMKSSVKEGEYSGAGINSFSFTFPPKSYRYKDRDGRFDSAGDVYSLHDQRIVRIDNPAPGCVGWAVGSFGKRPSDKDVVRYTVENKIEAIGIRAISKKSVFYKRIGSRFDSTRAYLVTGDVVVVLKTSSNYSYVRYTNPDSASEGRVTTGWVRSADLVDPFPPANKQ
ncbi:hypothetical protein PPMP20_04185 [Paraburkholderia phymatum]|nr:hypothetical protein [Paraburkholderia phymatum]